MATSSGLPGRILSRLWRVVRWPLVLLADVTFFDGWLGRGFGGRRPPKGFWSDARTGSTRAPRRPAPNRPTAPPPPATDYFGEEAG